MVGPDPAMTSGGACMRARVVSSKPVAPDHTLSPITSIRSDAAGSGTTAAGVSASASVTAGVSAPSGAYTAIIPFAAMRSAQTAASALLGSRPARSAPPAAAVIPTDSSSRYGSRHLFIVMVGLDPTMTGIRNKMAK